MAYPRNPVFKSSKYFIGVVAGLCLVGFKENPIWYEEGTFFGCFAEKS